MEYFEENGLVDVKLIVPKIKIKQLVSYNGSRVWLAGITGPSIIVHNATELFTDNRTDMYVKQFVKLLEMAKNPTFDVNCEKYEFTPNRERGEKITIDRESNIKLYDFFLSKFDCSKFKGVSSYVTFGKNLSIGREKFVALTVSQQVNVLNQIVNFFKCNAETADIELIGGSKISGKILFNKNITDVDFRIISQSPCGLTVHVKRV